jgi:hypothetical protein
MVVFFFCQCPFSRGRRNTTEGEGNATAYILRFGILADKEYRVAYIIVRLVLKINRRKLLDRNNFILLNAITWDILSLDLNAQILAHPTLRKLQMAVILLFQKRSKSVSSASQKKGRYSKLGQADKPQTTQWSSFPEKKQKR